MERPLKVSAKVSFFVAAVFALLLLHFYRLAELPGLHYDEAWAMNYAWRIAAEPGFWPWAAMSPYTAPWAHYWAALWLKLFGPSLAVFRFSQVALSLAGLAALALSLPSGPRRFFPWAALLLPGLLLNHRFSIELTGFHVLAFGALCLSLRKRWWPLAAFAALAGTTAHILFYGVALGLLGALCLEALALEKKARLAAAAYFFLTALFFVQVLLALPEKGKAGALVFSALAAAMLLLFGFEKWALWRNPWWKKLLPILAAVFVFNAFFFAQGTWSGAVATGMPKDSLLVKLAFFAFLFGLPAIFFGFRRGVRSCPPWIFSWFLLGTFFLGLMMLKPAPRYFETALLGIAAFLSFGFYELFTAPKMTRKIKLIFAALAVNFVFGGLALFFSDQPRRENAFRFLFFKDNSRDFLDKQSLVQFLGSSGCALSGIETHDPRLLESLKALSLGDWPVDGSKNCPYGYVARKTEEGASGEEFGEFFLKRKP